MTLEDLDLAVADASSAGDKLCQQMKAAGRITPEVCERCMEIERRAAIHAACYYCKLHHSKPRGTLWGKAFKENGVWKHVHRFSGEARCDAHALHERERELRGEPAQENMGSVEDSFGE